MRNTPYKPQIRRVIKELIDAELIKSIRGRNGGYALAKPANKMSLWDIMIIFEPNLALRCDHKESYSNTPVVDALVTMIDFIKYKASALTLNIFATTIET